MLMCSIDQRSGGDQCHYFRKTDGYQRSEERAARKYSDYGFVLALICVALICLLYPTAASAWGYKGHRVVGSIADQMLHDNAKAQVSQILSYEDSPDQGVAITLRIAGPWADCVKSVVQLVDPQGHVTYSYEPSNPEFRIPCTSFEKDHQHPIEQARMEDYVGRNFSQCSYAPRGKEEGCHNTYHFDDVAFQRDRFDRSYLETNEHDLVAAITAAIAMLKDNKAPAPFSIKDKKEALFMLAHFVGDPDSTHQIDPESVTAGGNRISVRDQCLMNAQNQCINFHAEWDENPARALVHVKCFTTCRHAAHASTSHGTIAPSGRALVDHRVRHHTHTLQSLAGPRHTTGSFA